MLKTFGLAGICTGQTRVLPKAAGNPAIRMDLLKTFLCVIERYFALKSWYRANRNRCYESSRQSNPMRGVQLEFVVGHAILLTVCLENGNFCRRRDSPLGWLDRIDYTGNRLSSGRFSVPLQTSKVAPALAKGCVTLAPFLLLHT